MRQQGKLTPTFAVDAGNHFIKCFCGEWALIATAQAQCKCGITLFLDGSYLLPMGTSVFVCDLIMPIMDMKRATE